MPRHRQEWECHLAAQGQPAAPSAPTYLHPLSGQQLVGKSTHAGAVPCSKARQAAQLPLVRTPSGSGGRARRASRRHPQSCASSSAAKHSHHGPQFHGPAPSKAGPKTSGCSGPSLGGRHEAPPAWPPQPPPQPGRRAMLGIRRYLLQLCCAQFLGVAGAWRCTMTRCRMRQAARQQSARPHPRRRRWRHHGGVQVSPSAKPAGAALWRPSSKGAPSFADSNCIQARQGLQQMPRVRDYRPPNFRRNLMPPSLPLAIFPLANPALHSALHAVDGPPSPLERSRACPSPGVSGAFWANMRVCANVRHPPVHLLRAGRRALAWARAGRTQPAVEA